MSLHARRIGTEQYNFALWDTVLTVLGGAVISKKFNYNFWLVMLVLTIFFILIHKVTNTKTALNDIIFNDPLEI